MRAKRAVVSIVLILGAALGAGGCETNATTGRSQPIIFSWEQEVALGIQESPKMIQEFGGESPKSELRAYVKEVGDRLAAAAIQADPSLAQLPWEFTLLNSDVVNAFALPGGKVFITRGMAGKLTSEAQLAGVLGHEIGHVAARHTNERIASAQWAQLGIGAAGALAGAEYGQIAQALGSQGAGFWLLSYGRDQESESDALGLRYMVASGYNPIGQQQVMEVLASMDQAGRQPEFLSTHPYPEERINNIQLAISEQYAHTQNNPQFKTGEREYRDRFLNRLSAAWPGGYDRSEQMVRLASVGMTHADCD